MSKLVFRTFATAVLAAVVLSAGPREVLVKLSGQQLAGNFSSWDEATGMILNGNFSPTILENGSEGILAFWSACLFIPDPNTPDSPIFTCPIVAAGIAPKSAIKIRGDSVEVNFDTAKMISVISLTGPSILKGTFTRYTGLFSFSHETTGTQTITSVFPSATGTTLTYVEKTTGKRQNWPATFTGQIGPFVIVPPEMGYNGGLVLHQGGHALIRTEQP